MLALFLLRITFTKSRSFKIMIYYRSGYVKLTQQPYDIFLTKKILTKKIMYLFIRYEFSVISAKDL